jgi:hypothetical protein
MLANWARLRVVHFVEDVDADGFSLVQMDTRLGSCKTRASAAAQLYCIAIIMSFLFNAQCLPSTTISLDAELTLRRFRVCACFECSLGRLTGNM